MSWQLCLVCTTAYNSPAVLPTGDIIQQRGKVFDFIFHVGVAGPGPLRLVKMARKTGYQGEDIDGCYAPVVSRYGKRVVCGFGEGYEDFPEILYTKVDTHELQKALEASGVRYVNWNVLCAEDDAHQ